MVLSPVQIALEQPGNIETLPLAEKIALGEKRVAVLTLELV